MTAQKRADGGKWEWEEMTEDKGSLGRVEDERTRKRG